MTTTNPSRTVDARTEATIEAMIEATIAGYWRELLGTEAVTPDDDFIALGGNSMLATMLANRIEDELGVRPQIVDLFATLGQVAGACAALLRESRGDAGRGA